MEERKNLTLRAVGDLVFQQIQDYLFRDSKDRGIELFIQQGQLQEMHTLLMPDKSRILVKIYPHKNYASNLVFRMEVYKTLEGDLRGNKVEFFEADSEELTPDELHGFVETFLARIETY